MVPDIEPRRLQPTRFQRPTTSGQHAWLDRDAEEDIAEGHDVDRQSMMSQCLDVKVDVRVLRIADSDIAQKLGRDRESAVWK